MIVEYQSWLAYKLKIEKEELEVEQGASIKEILYMLRENSSVHQDLLSKENLFFIVKDGEIITDYNTKVSNNCLLSLIPPLSGG